MGKHVVVLGGGIGGVSCAKALRRQLSNDHTVTLVNDGELHVYQPSLLWVAFGLRKPDSIVAPLSRLEKRGISFHQGKVQSIERDQKRVVTDSGELSYDYLVVALGAQLAPERVPGLSENANIFYARDGAKKTPQAIEGFQGGRAVIAVCSMPYKCPAAPYEAAFLLDSELRRRQIRNKSKISIVTFEPQPMPTAGPVVGKAISDMLAQRDIEYLTKTAPKEIDGASNQVATDGEPVDYDLLLGVPPHVSPTLIAESSLSGETGWIPVDKHSLITNDDHIYALGDVTTVKLKNGKMLPKAGVIAHKQGDVVAHQIAARINGSESSEAFDGKGSCFLELGAGKAGYAEGDFYAEPDPKVQLKSAGRIRHLEKAALEKWWLWRL